MKEYHKIQTVFERDPETKFKTLLEEYSLPEFEYLKNNKWIFTEKVDGTNIRVKYQDGKIILGGKSERTQIPATLVERLFDIFTTDRFAMHFEDDVCLYGEGYGAKIQKGGGNYSSNQDFVLFDVKIGDFWLHKEDVDCIAKGFGINSVPIIGEGTLKEMVEKTKAGFESQWGPFQAEGIVARPATELKTRSGHRIITKIKCKDFK